jgi:hypothetical protein
MTKSSVAAELEAIKTALEALEPLKEDQRKFAIDTIVRRLGTFGAPAERPPGIAADAPGIPAGVTSTGQAPNSRQFLRSKAPVTDLERYVCLAYYLTHFMSTPKFTSREIQKLNSDAGGQNFSNAAATATNATRQSKLLGNAGQGKRRITLRGEELVEALPDRQKVAALIKSRGGRKGGRKSKK